uniref:Uncharacterized protein n=1 Tax=Candidatus Kentrum sp. TUN TaxID=2126343 RepID=A0A450ZRK8_9GAMM|nr:MAG: hypothetical protein BECKTUN1418F_GA0071002_104115 [Candidatus Kentron sp. TUN]VFK56407.1 MAG: hypothetical protein BECKTUN1418E_GA0071001_104115 [Candidatus Kentron sp. TUN]VFK60582.1 MAG: hypothetical protein BECKTUN1418D_GA0071000_11305 [Candidatus Kentron sp. TUN]
MVNEILFLFMLIFLSYILSNLNSNIAILKNKKRIVLFVLKKLRFYIALRFLKMLADYL